ncbi:MAG: hypothetical protein ACR2IL_05850 [Chitinophagaceae bacterium]
MPEKRFFILTQGRTGSNLLCSLLNSHPQIAADGEIMNKKEQLKTFHPWRVKWIRLFPHQYIQSRCNKLLKNQKTVYGFKLLVEQWPQPIEHGVQSLIDRQFLPIYLFRKNTISQLISTTLANQQKRWVVNSEEDYNQPPIALDLNLASEKMSQIAQRSITLNKLSQQYPGLMLYYEDHLLNTAMFNRAAALVCPYLGVELAPMQTKMLKTDIRTDRERISNFDEFLSFMSASGYEKEVAYYLEHELTNQ